MPLKNAEGLALCCGMIRSASTLQYQVVSELVERNGLGQRAGFADPQTVSRILKQADATPGLTVVKVHEILPQLESRIAQGGIRAFYTFRDLRAVAVSVMRRWGIPFTQVIARNGWLDAAVTCSNHWLSMPGVCVSRYEDMLLELPAEIGRWAGALDLSITDTQAGELAEQFAIDAQKERLRKMSAWQSTAPGAPDGYFDADSPLHPEHIDDGSLDAWKEKLERWQVRQIESRFSSWLRDHGYPVGEIATRADYTKPSC